MARILLIEDDPEVTENIVEILELENHQVQTANNGLVGIDLLNISNPDLIICDVTMPEKNGYEVLQFVRSNPKTFSTPFIFLTAKSEKNDLRRGMELGADDYITKPFDYTDIINSINTRLEYKKKAYDFYDKQLENLILNITTSIPHELRTPLNTILGFSQILRSGYKEMEEQELQTIFDNIHDAGLRLLRLIVNYIFYTKLLANEHIISEKEEQMLNVTDDMIINMCNNIADIYRRKNDLVINLGVIKGKISSEHFLKIIEELVHNGFKFSQRDTNVELKVRVYDNNLIIEVTNFGRGMTAEEINAIGAFQQFNRREFEQQGLGLGLAIVKKITEIYNGKLTIDSEPDKQTVVKVLIPIK
ncbi:MAG: response regulator [Candidatus Kapabacteria bacterium]|nr:response regulator [Candidatus Kapabacteria bacterium]